MTRMRRRTVVRRTCLPKVAAGYSSLLVKLSTASALLKKSRKR